MGILKETYTDESEQTTVENKNEQYKQAILTAIGSESSAWNEYDTILGMETDVDAELVERFHDTLVDLRDEEMKHIGQLTTKIGEVPELQAAYEAGKKEAEEGGEPSAEQSQSEEEKEETEEVKESVLTESVAEKVPDNTRMFSSDAILDLILDNFEPTQDIQSALYQSFPAGEEYTAEEVDERLMKAQSLLNILPENMEALENMVISSIDPKVERAKGFRNDVYNDVGIIRNAIESVYTEAARVKLEKVVEELLSIEYSGDKNTGWTKDNTIYGDNPTEKVIG